MDPFTKVFLTLRHVARHPVNRDRKLKAVLEYGLIQIAARTVPGDICVKFPNDTRLLVPPRMKGAAHYIAPRICEFEEMAFVMHFVRPDDLFVDVGANIGAFTVLAGGVAGACTLSFEPVTGTFEMLTRNVLLNGLQGRAKTVRAAVGRKEGTVQLSVGFGTENRVTTNSRASDSASVPLTTLDKELAGRAATFLKVDVEGFESDVFAGASETLKQPKLEAMIVERGNMGLEYGFDEEALHRSIREHGFLACRYDPFTRQLSATDGSTSGIVIYVRDLAASNQRLRTAAKFTLGDLSV